MNKKFSFEQGLEELESIVTSLESGETTLEESFDAYKKGMELYKKLKQILDEGDARITELTENGEKLLQGENKDENE